VPITVLMMLLLIALCHHMALGLQVVAEDYVHSGWAKFPMLVAIHLACFALAVVGILSTLRVTFVSDAEF
jgi:succinate dehydrogenase / fumarate reductase membrane anchor subunit